MKIWFTLTTVCYVQFCTHVTCVLVPGNLPHKHKIVIAGNHELSFDRTFTHPLSHSPSDSSRGSSIVDQIPTLGMPRDNIAEAIKMQNIKDCLTNCTYLQDEAATLYGLKIYGTPW